jgi:polyphenol oxidase
MSMSINHPHAPSVVQADNLVPFSELLHGVTTRRGGVSTGPYRSLNLSFDVGDRRERVLQNYQLVSRLLDFDLRSLVACQQVHHNAIARVDESHLNRSSFLPETAIPATDGLATNIPGITLLTRYADCVPLLFFSPEQQAVAVAHAGWRGTLARIGPAMVDLLSAHFRCRPERTLVMIGPSIGPCCYQVSSSMADRASRELPPAEQRFVASPDGRIAFDLWEANRRQLIAAGVEERNMVAAAHCTSCNTNLFFSYRKEAQLTGRFGAFIGLRRRDGD